MGRDIALGGEYELGLENWKARRGKDLGSATENGPGTTSTSRARTQKSQLTIHIINKTNKGKTRL